MSLYTFRKQSELDNEKRRKLQSAEMRKEANEEVQKRNQVGFHIVNLMGKIKMYESI